MTKLTQFSFSLLMLSSALIATSVRADDDKAAIALLKSGDAPVAGGTFTQSMSKQAKKVKELTAQMRRLRDPEQKFGSDRQMLIHQMEPKLAEAESSLADTLKVANSHMRGGVLAQSEVQSTINDIMGGAQERVAVLQARLASLEAERAAALKVGHFDGMDDIVNNTQAVKRELAAAEKSAADKFNTFSEYASLSKADLEKTQSLAKIEGELHGLPVREINAAQLSILKEGGAGAEELKQGLFSRIGGGTKVLGGVFVAAGVAVTIYGNYGFFQDYDKVDGKSHLLGSGDITLQYAKGQKGEGNLREPGSDNLEAFVHH